MRADGRHSMGTPMALERAAVAPRSTNVVVLALAAALLDLEQHRDRGKVRRPMDRRRSV